MSYAWINPGVVQGSTVYLTKDLYPEYINLFNMKKFFNFAKKQTLLKRFTVAHKNIRSIISHVGGECNLNISAIPVHKTDNT